MGEWGRDGGKQRSWCIVIYDNFCLQVETKQNISKLYVCYINQL